MRLGLGIVNCLRVRLPNVLVFVRITRHSYIAPHRRHVADESASRTCAACGPNAAH
jgi:hypothetical protein